MHFWVEISTMMAWPKKQNPALLAKNASAKNAFVCKTIFVWSCHDKYLTVFQNKEAKIL